VAPTRLLLISTNRGKRKTHSEITRGWDSDLSTGVSAGCAPDGSTWPRATPSWLHSLPPTAGRRCPGRHAAHPYTSLTAAHGKLDQIIGMLGQLLDDGNGNGGR
jgi:hypothetical protein